MASRTTTARNGRDRSRVVRQSTSVKLLRAALDRDEPFAVLEGRQAGQRTFQREPSALALHDAPEHTLIKFSSFRLPQLPGVGAARIPSVYWLLSIQTGLPLDVA